MGNKNLKNGKRDRSRIQSHFALELWRTKKSCTAKANRQINIQSF
jgi:hypothetical protein